jgi:hypothetical protein
MAVQIQEMVIRATITESGKTEKVVGANQPDNASALKDEIIHECIEKLMEIFKSKNER